MKVHLLSSFPHYRRHLDPIWDQIPDDVKGDVIDPIRPRIYRLPKDDVIIIGGGIDIDGDQKQRYIYVEHGAGQSYTGVTRRIGMSYAGGEHPSNVVGYVSPSQRVADSWKRPAIAVGCPALDNIKRHGDFQTVAMTFHMDAPQVCHEARSARDHYIDYLHNFVARVTGDYRWTFVGHAHPRDKWAEGIWKNLGVEFEPDPDVVLSTAGLIVADNTSLLYEAAALGVRTVALNAPWYRRNVNHGMRFWDFVPGHQIDDPIALCTLSLTNVGLTGHRRREVVDAAYSHPPGSGGGKRAADWILELVG